MYQCLLAKQVQFGTHVSDTKPVMWSNLHAWVKISMSGAKHEPVKTFESLSKTGIIIIIYFLFFEGG